MPASEALALALVLSIPTAGGALLVGIGLDRLIQDARMRARAWRLAMVLPLAPMGLVWLNAAAPDPVVTASPMALDGTVGPIAVLQTPAVPAVSEIDWAWMAALALSVMALIAGWRFVRLAALSIRQARLLREAKAAPDGLRIRMSAAASRIGVRSPLLGLSDGVHEPTLSGLLRPVLMLPTSWRDQPPEAADAILAHEAAHLSRGDHHALWLDEALVALLAFNPLIGPIRTRLAAAREEACDALCLDGLTAPERRAYAHAYLQALEAPRSFLPALSFAGEPRRLAMRRLKSILTPPAQVSIAARLAAGLGALVMLGLAGGAAWAAASQDSGSPARTYPLPDLDQIEREMRAEMGDEAYDAQTRAYEMADGVDYQRICATGHAGDEGFCAGIIYGVIARDLERANPELCVPEPYHISGERIEAQVLQVGAMPTDTPADVARRAAAAAYPCGQAIAETHPRPEIAAMQVYDFIRMATPEQIRSAAPDGAAHEAAIVRLQCRILDGAGRLGECGVLYETPATRGFGPAALGLLDEYRLRTPDNGGRLQAGSIVVFSINWEG